MIPPEYLDSLHAALASRAEAVCSRLLPGGKKIQQRWSCGGVDGGPGKSMDVELAGEKAGVWHDRASGEAGKLLKLWQLQGMSFKDAVDAAADFCRMPKPTEEDRKIDPSCFDFRHPEPAADSDNPPAYKAAVATVIDWDRCVSELTPEKASELCEWRGYSPEFVTHLRNEKLIGCYNGSFAFPVTGATGKVTAIHYKGPDGWRYFPNGAESSIFVLGSPNHASHTLVFESQWDAFAVLDKLRAHEPENAGVYAALVTRSATSNTDLGTFPVAHLIACPQNDPREKTGKDGITRQNLNKEGRTPSEEWLHRVQSGRNKITQFVVFETPVPHKDANDWIRADQPEHEEVFRRLIESAKNPILKDSKTVRELLEHNIEDDPDALIGHKRRFLSKGGSWMIIGPSGVGKSTLVTSLCIHAAAGVAWHGLTFRRPLKTLVIQAENDAGDLAEMLKGSCAAVRKDFTKGQFHSMGQNLTFQQVTDKIGQKFCQWLEEMIRETGADLVVIDPLLSFVGDDISQQKVASQFFRNWLQPILERTGVILVLVHHTGKPPKEKVKDVDLSYSGLGSSEIVNWPRAVSVLVTTDQPDTFLFKNCKRGKRAQMLDQFSGTFSTDIYLRHGDSSEGSQWIQCKYDQPVEEDKPWKGRGASLPPSMKPEDVLPLLGNCFTYKDLYDTLRQAGNFSASAAKKIIADLNMSRHLVRGADGFYRKTEGTFC